MKKRVAVILLVVVLLVAAAVALVVWTYSRTVVLGEKYPFLADETISASVSAWSTQTDHAPIITGEGFAPIIRDARVTKGVKTQQGPDVGMLIYLPDRERKVTYSVEVGSDGKITVARRDDLVGTRTYWKDKDGNLFDKLYQCYLKNGGMELECE